jgi:hypothetical protein
LSEIKATQNWPGIRTAIQNELTCPTELHTSLIKFLLNVYHQKLIKNDLLTKIASCHQNMTRLPQNLLEEYEKAKKLMMDNNQNGLLSSGKSRYAIFINDGISNQYIRIIEQ